MKAAIYYGPADFRIREVECPKPGDAGVVVKVGACGICPIMDLDAWFRMPPEGVGVGLAWGHEWSGEIVEVGPKVKDFNVGDKIYQNPVFRPCYKCASCLVGDYWRCVNWMAGLSQRGIHGAFAEYLWIPFITKESAAKLPKDLGFRDLALIEPLYLSVGLARKAMPGDTVVVLGVELMGLGTIAKLKERDVKVIAYDTSEKRLKASKDVGADLIINDLTEDGVRAVMKETGGRGADVAIVIDPRPKAIFDAIKMMKRAGQVWLATGYNNLLQPSPHSQSPPGGMFWIGPNAGYMEPPIRFDPALVWVQTAWGTLGPRVPRWLEAAELIKSGKVTAEKYVKIYSLEKISEAFETALHPDTIKVLVEP
jgi:threonine dehydrogenase-like Zn-dependent dehydrogenase